MIQVSYHKVQDYYKVSSYYYFYFLFTPLMLQILLNT